MFEVKTQRWAKAWSYKGGKLDKVFLRLTKGLVGFVLITAISVFAPFVGGWECFNHNEWPWE